MFSYSGASAAGLKPSGDFWLPEYPDRRFQGLYEVLESGSASVEFLGQTSLQQWRTEPVVHGIVEGTPVTLFDAYLHGWRNAGEYRTERRIATMAIEGGHFPTRSEATFRSATLVIHGMETWVDAWYFSGMDGPAISTEDDRHPYHLPYLTAEARDAKFTLKPDFQLPDGYTKLMWPHTLAIEVEEALDFETFWRVYVRPLRDLLLHVLRKPIDVDIKHLMPESSPGSRDFKTYEVRRYSPSRGSSFSRLWPLWSLHDVTFGEAVERWFDLDDKVGVSLMLLEQAMDDQSGWPATRFLSAVAAAESFARILNDETPYDFPKWLQPAAESLKSRYRSRLRKKMSRVDGVTLAGRLAQMVEALPIRVAMRTVLNGHRVDARTDWAKAVAKARNHLAHGGTEAAAMNADPARLYRMTDELIGLVTLRIAQELGFTHEERLFVMAAELHGDFSVRHDSKGKLRFDRPTRPAERSEASELQPRPSPDHPDSAPAPDRPGSP